MEIWDLYDKDRQPLHKTITRGEDFVEGEYHIVAHVLIFDEENKLLIQRRSADKSDYPLYWAFSVGGSALSGENSYETVIRETKEEIGLDLSLHADNLSKRPFFTLNFRDGFDDYFLAKLPFKIDLSKLKLQEEEVCEVKMADKDEILNLKKEGLFVPYFDEIIGLAFRCAEELTHTTDFIEK